MKGMLFLNRKLNSTSKLHSLESLESLDNHDLSIFLMPNALFHDRNNSRIDYRQR